MPGTLTTIVGDATKPKMLGQLPIIIPHVCNTIGGWGMGFVLALSRAFGPNAETAYRHWAHEKAWIPIEKSNVKVMGRLNDQRRTIFELGSTQLVKFPKDSLVIANMVAQHRLGKGDDGRPAIRYAALATCMGHVAKVAKIANAEIHCPKFGSDLAGGDWNVISQMIQELWTDGGINVTVYEFPKP